MKNSLPSEPSAVTSSSPLESSERLSGLALESGQLGSWSLDVATQHAQRSLRHDQIFGYDGLAPDWTYSTFLEHVDRRDREHVDTAYRKALEAGEDWEFDTRIHRVDGEERWISAKGKHFRNDSGQVTEIIGLVADRGLLISWAMVVAKRPTATSFSLRRDAMSACRRSVMLEAVTNLLYLAKTSDRLEEIREYLGIAEVELQRVATIANQTLRFQRSKSVACRTSPEKLFHGIETMFARRAGNQSVSYHRCHRTEQTILCFDGEIRQVLTNLIGNAVDAMQSGGQLHIRSRSYRNRVGLHGVLITIADTGSGMSDEVKRKIYDPFFSTKGMSGSGLGLSVSLDIVNRHHGRLAVRTSQRPTQHGSVFHLFLPSEMQPEEQQAA